MRRRAARDTSHNTRKETGRFYTPPWLTQRIVAETMTPMVERLTPNQFLSLRILDPAMGDGNFLLEAANFLQQALRRQDIIRNCLFGVDSDADAVAQARATLAAEGGLDADGRRELERHLAVGNALLDPFPVAGPERFDVILSNPPYVGFKLWSKDKQLRQFLQRNYECFDWHADLFYFFIERGLRLLAPGGRMGVVTSRYFLRSPSAAKLRALAEPHMVKFIDLNDSDAFADLGIHCAISIYAQSPTKARTYATPRDVPTFDAPTAPLAHVADVRAGLQSGRDAVYVKAVSEEGGRFYGTRPDGKRIELEPNLIRPFIKNRDIQPYRVAPSRYCLFVGDGLEPDALRRKYPKAFRFLESHKDQLLSRRSSFKKVSRENWTQWMHWTRLHFSQTRIVCPYRSTSNRFALAPAGALGSIDVGFISPQDVNPLYLLALLNSRLMERTFQSYAKELRRGVYDYYPGTLGRLPIRTIPPATPPRERRSLVAQFQRTFRDGEAMSWIEQRPAPDVLRDVLILLARRLIAGEWEDGGESAAIMERIVETLYAVR
ncbi:MAG: N-6 DNA methylase [Planctomycetota bacterium]